MLVWIKDLLLNPTSFKNTMGSALGAVGVLSTLPEAQAVIADASHPYAGMLTAVAAYLGGTMTGKTSA